MSGRVGAGKMALCLSFAFVCVACGPGNLWDAMEVDRLSPGEIGVLHRRLLEQASTCFSSRCGALMGVRSRNDLQSLKCNTLELTLAHYRDRCAQTPGRRTTASQEINPQTGLAEPADCRIEGNDVVLLYDSLSILQCL